MIAAMMLFLMFVKIGLFTIGGGLAALPLLQDELVGSGRISQEDFIDMVAVSQATPGPIGINMATYIGYREMGVPGAMIATGGMVTPSIVIILLIARFMRNVAHRPEVIGALSGLRPSAVGLIAAATWYIFSRSLLDLSSFPSGPWLDGRATWLFAGLCLLYWRFPTAYPVLFILLGAALGIMLF